MRIVDAQIKATLELRRLFNLKADLTCTVYLYVDKVSNRKRRPWVGVRVAEISFYNASGGASFMQVDIPYGLLLCAAVERYILALVDGWEDIEIEEELWRLEEVVRYCQTEKE